MKHHLALAFCRCCLKRLLLLLIFSLSAAAGADSLAQPAPAGAAVTKGGAAQKKWARRRARRPSPTMAGARARREVRRGGSVRAARAPEPRRAVYAQAAGEPGEDVEGRESWFNFKRAYPFDTVPAGARRRAWDSRPRPGKGARMSLSGERFVWTPLGPRPTVPPPTPKNWGGTSGRINSVAVSPANTQVVLVGSSTGGIWRSSDGGANFVPVSDDQLDIAVSWIAFAPSNPAIVYAAMGDIDYEYLGAGVLKSTDGGQTWARASNATLPDGVIARLEVDPTNPDRVYLAQFLKKDRSTNLSTESGFFLSTDGGVNWTKTLAGQLCDIVIHPANPQTLYVGLSGQSRLVDGGSPAGLYRSTDGGHTWANIPVPTTGLHAGLWDFRVALTPADPQRIYVYYGTIFFGETRFQVSSDGGATWQSRSLANVDSGLFGFATYLFADPSNANTVYLGARDLYKSTDGGATWRNMTNNFAQSGESWRYQPSLSSTHADQQAFAFEPGNPAAVYLANDGGLWKSADGGTTLQSLNTTLSLVQFNSLAVHPTDAGFTMGGTQDNGTQRRLRDAATGEPTVRWRDFSGSDGGRCVINPLNPSIVFGTYYSGWVNRFKVSGSEVFFEKEIGTFSTWGETNINTRIAFYPPFTGNGVDQKLYFGTWRLFVSSNLGDSWTAPAGTTDLTKGGRDVLSAIGVARSNTEVIYTGSAQGRAMVSNDGGASWTDVTAGLPNRFIEEIAVHPHNPSVAYLTVSGYGTGHVFRTDNMGATWADVSGDLPNVPVSALLIDPLTPSTVYAGTDIGVFRSTSGGSQWESFNAGMPPVIVTAFAAQPGGRIQVATYGRGAYELTAVPVGASSVALGVSSVEVSERAGSVRLDVTRTGDLSVAARVDYNTSGGTASDRSDYNVRLGTLRFAEGEATKTVEVFINDDAFVEAPEAFSLSLGNPVDTSLGGSSSATVTIISDDASAGPSPVRDGSFDAEFFVRQHYRDFLNREPDAAGLAFWVNQITECELLPAAERQGCREIRRINVSAAFFLAIEFQETGFLAYRTHQAAYGTGKAVRLRAFMADTQDIGRGVVIGQAGAEGLLEQNKRRFFDEFVARAQFSAAYPAALTPDAFVDALNANTGGSLSPAERDALVRDLSAKARTRAQVLRSVVEDADFGAREKNNAFVLMQYFGYLRRNPDDSPNTDFSGYDFWLQKLNSFGGNFVSAEMVKAFITAGEYQERFGQ